MLLSIKRDEWLGNVKNDLLGGLVTAVALIPEVIGFAIIAGVNPMTALFASVITAIVTSLTGGRPAMMSAAAGSMALVMVVLIKNHGIEYMIAATILTGVFQLLFGYLGIHKLMRFISKPVMMGFVNALALLIFFSANSTIGASKWNNLCGGRNYGCVDVCFTTCHSCRATRINYYCSDDVYCIDAATTITNSW